jgi:hypothetical protein
MVMGSCFLAILAWLAPYGCDRLVGNVPMVLYGTVVDQSAQPVAGAALEFRAFRSSRIPVPVMFYSGNVVEWRLQVTTGADGAFCVHAGRGQNLSIASVTKPGYVDSKCGPGAFTYAGQPSSQHYRPDPSHPVVFIMWNQSLKNISAKRSNAPPETARK